MFLGLVFVNLVPSHSTAPAHKAHTTGIQQAYNRYTTATSAQEPQSECTHNETKHARLKTKKGGNKDATPEVEKETLEVAKKIWVEKKTWPHHKHVL